MKPDSVLLPEAAFFLDTEDLVLVNASKESIILSFTLKNSDMEFFLKEQDSALVRWFSWWKRQPVHQKKKKKLGVQFPVGVHT